MSDIVDLTDFRFEEGVNFLSDDSMAWGVKKGDRVLAYPMYKCSKLSHTSTVAGQFITWLQDRGKRAAPLTRKLTTKLADEVGSPDKVHGTVDLAGTSDVRCPCCVALDNDVKGFGETDRFPCIVPVLFIQGHFSPDVDANSALENRYIVTGK